MLSITTKPVHNTYWACALEPRSGDYWAHLPQLLKPVLPRACALKQKKPLQREAWAPQPEKSPGNSEDPAQSKINK